MTRSSTENASDLSSGSSGVVSLAQLSDPHLTSPRADGRRWLGLKRWLSWQSWRRKRRFRHRSEVLACVVADLHAEAPGHILVSGDLTHLGLPAECREAACWLAALGEPARVSVIPGNHDVLVRDDWSATVGCWAPFFASDPSASAGPSAPAFPFVRLLPTGSGWVGDVALIGINSAVPTPPFFAHGRVDPEQLAGLRRLLDEHGRAGRFRLVCIHHSPLSRGHAWRKRLRNAAQLKQVLREHGVELVVHGHGHEEALDGLPTVAGEALVVGVPSASHAGSQATGTRAAGWNHYRISRDTAGWQVVIERRRWAPAPGSASDREGFGAAPGSLSVETHVHRLARNHPGNH